MSGGLATAAHDPAAEDMAPPLQAWTEKRKRRQAVPRDKKTKTVMARYLLESWGFGLQSGIDVQREAAMAVADGADHEDLVMLAKLGSAVHDDHRGQYHFHNGSPAHDAM